MLALMLQTGVAVAGIKGYSGVLVPEQQCFNCTLHFWIESFVFYRDGLIRTRVGGGQFVPLPICFLIFYPLIVISPLPPFCSHALIISHTVDFHQSLDWFPQSAMADFKFFWDLLSPSILKSWHNLVFKRLKSFNLTSTLSGVCNILWIYGNTLLPFLLLLSWLKWSKTVFCCSNLTVWKYLRLS